MRGWSRPATLSRSRKHEVSAMGDVLNTRGRAQASRHRGAGSSGRGRSGRGAAYAAWLREPAGWAAIVLVTALLAALAGCHSSAPTEPTAMPPAEPAAEAPSAAQAVAPQAIQVTGVQVREGAPETTVEISSTEPLVWTSFRDASGNVVVELPNSSVAPGVGDLAPESGLVSSVTVSEEQAGTRPMSRLVIATRENVEQKLRADGNRLLVELRPAGEPASQGTGSLAFEPIAEEEPAPEPVLEPAEPSPATPQPALGTPDQPVVGPAPTGATASSLSDVEVTSEADRTVVRIEGDGEFSYSTFSLSDPERFVVDLSGVVNRSSRPLIAVDAGPVERIRVAQFKPLPQPVSRVVFDLRQPRYPHIERSGDALLVSFEGPAAAPSRAPRPARPVPQPPAPPAMTATAPAEGAPIVTGSPEPEDLEPTPAEQAQSIEVSNVPPAAPPPAPSEPAPRPKIELEGTPPQVQTLPGSNLVATTPAGRSPAAAPPSDAALFGPSEVQIQPPAGPAGPVTGLRFGTQQVSSGERKYTGAPIDMTLRDADVVETLRSFSKIAGLNIVIQPDVKGGRVTVELENVPWDQALEQILKINNLGYELEGNIMRIAPLEDLRKEAQARQQLEAAKALSVPLETVMKRLSYTSAANVANILKRSGSGGILSQRGNVIVDQRTNTLIISELPDYMDTVLAIIDNLDEPEPQVMIEARIIETTKRFSRTLGIDWGFNATAGPATGNSTGLEFPNNVDASGSVNLPTGGQNGLLRIGLGNILDTFRLDAVLNAAEDDGLVNILSTPKVATLNNHTAQIQSGLQIPIQTVANNTVSVQFVNATLKLQVTPQITADGTVVMDINIQKREVQTAFLVPGATNAPIATKEATTQVLVKDGGTAVIGGIYEVSTDQSQQKVPGLANIPIIGHLFKNRDRSDQNQELLIFITPRVIRL